MAGGFARGHFGLSALGGLRLTGWLQPAGRFGRVAT
jgi:hypothetical protein